MFGVIPEQEQLGYPAEDRFVLNSSKLDLIFLIFSPECSTDREAILMPHLEALADFRESVRTMAKEHKNVNILQVHFLFITHFINS